MSEERFVKLTLTLPRDLRERMDADGQDVNWSAVARAAFEERLAELKRRRSTVEAQVVERLRESKRQEADAEYQKGWNEGEQWAKSVAGYGALSRLATWYEKGAHSLDPYSAYFAMHPEEDRNNIGAAVLFWDEDRELGLTEARKLLSESFIRGWCEAAVDIFRKVDPQL